MASVFDNNISVDASGNATVDGDLTVSGDTTTVSTTNTVIQDKLIELANGTSGTPAGDAGIIVERGSSTNAAIVWDESADTWKACTTSATGASSGNLTLTDAALAAAAITASGDITTTGDIILDDGGSLKEAGGTAAITFDGDGNVTKIGQDSPSTNEVLTYDGAKWVAASAASGDITGVTAGNGLSGGGSSGGVSLALDLDELTGATVAVAADSIVIIDADDSNSSKKESIADFVSGIAGSGLSAASGQLSYDGSITGGALTFGNGQNATATVDATAHNAAGKNLTLTAGKPTAGTTNNIAGGSLTLQGGQGKGSGAGGDIIFQTANAGGSGSSLNSHATALTISDDLSATFAGEAIISEGNLKLGSTAVTATAAEINVIADNGNRVEAVVNVAQDYLLFFDGGENGDAKTDSIADIMTGVAGTQATTGLTASSGTLVLTDLHPVGVDGSANQLLTDDGDGTVTSEAKAKVDGATMTIGDGTAEDASLQFDGNTVDFYVGIDDSSDALVLGVGGTLGTNVGLGINGNGQVQAFDAFGASTGGTFGTFGSSDTTPSVATGNLWKTHASEQTLSDFDDGLAGQIIVVISTAAVTFDVTSSGLKGGSTDIVTASGDVTVWAYDGTDWHLVQFMDVSADMSSVGGGGGGMSNFVLEDGDGTEVTIGDGKEVKFVEGGGIDINWTDTDNGTDGDPYDLTFTVEATGVGTALATGGVRGTADQLGEVLFNQVMSG